MSENFNSVENLEDRYNSWSKIRNQNRKRVPVVDHEPNHLKRFSFTNPMANAFHESIVGLFDFWFGNEIILNLF